MPLNDLTLDDLRKLSDWLVSIAHSGFRLEQDGLAPRFDLTPGMPIRVTLGAVMPPATRPDFGAWLAQQATHPTESAAEDLPSFLKPRPMEAAPPAVGAEPVDPPPALGEVAGGGPISAEPSRSAEVAVSPGATKAEAQAESGGGQAVAAAEPPAAPVPGSASALAAQAGQWAGAWTEAQDDTLIEAIATAQIYGTPKVDAITTAAIALGRSFKAVEQRSYRIGGKIKAEVARRAMQQAQNEAPEIPAAQPSPSADGDSAVGGHSPAAVQNGDPLIAHLRGLTNKGGWSLARDLELLELSCNGWPAADIAREIQMPDAAVKPRFDALTGLHDDEVTGKKARRWTREEVLGALLIMAGKAAA